MATLAFSIAVAGGTAYAANTMLAVNFDVPGVEESDVFWADGPFRNSDLTWAPFSTENGQGLGFGNITSNAKAVCVTTPTN